MSKDIDDDLDLEIDDLDLEIDDSDFDLEFNFDTPKPDKELNEDDTLMDMDMDLNQDDSLMDMDMDLNEDDSVQPNPDFDLADTGLSLDFDFTDNLPSEEKIQTQEDKLKWVLRNLKEKSGYTSSEDLAEMESIDVDLENRNQYQEFINLYRNVQLFNRVLKEDNTSYYKDINSMGELPILNMDVSELFIDRQNHLYDLMQRFRRKLKNAKDENSVTVKSFLEESLPEEISSKCNSDITSYCKTVIDLLKDAIAVETIETALQQLKENSLRERRNLDKQKSGKIASLNKMKKMMFHEYDSTLDLLDDISDYMTYIEDKANTMYKEKYAEEIQLGVRVPDIKADNNLRMTYMQMALEDESVSTSTREFKVRINDTNYTFSIPIETNPINHTYTCNCDTVNEIKIPFESIVYLKNGTVKLPGINQCKHCKAYNYMPDSLGMLKDTVPKAIAETLKANTSESDFSALYYVPPHSSANVYIPTESKHSKAVQSNTDIKKAIDRYFEKLNRCKDVDLQNDSSSHFLAKVFMGRYYLSYAAYDTAIQVIIHHLETSSFGYGAYLKYSSQAYYDSVLASKGVLNQLRELEKDKEHYNEFKNQVFNVKRMLDIDFSEEDQCSKSDIEIIKDGFARVEVERDDFINHRNKFITDIKRNIRNLGNLPLNQIKISDDEYMDYMCVPEVRDLIMTWADYLVIYSNTQSFINFALAYRSKFTNKDFQTKLLPDTEFYEVVSKKFFKTFELTATDSMPSLYPTTTINDVLILSLKLKKAYNKDVYDYCKLLLEFLQSVLKVSDNYPYIMCGFKNVELEIIKNAIIDFLEQYPNKIYFYLSSQFSKDEIDGSGVVGKNIKWSRYMPKRIEGETLNQYLTRLKTKAKDDKCVPIDFSIVNQINKISVLVDSLNILAAWAFESDTLSSINIYFTGKYIIDSVLFSKEGYDITKCLGINEQDVNSILNKYGSIEDKFSDSEYQHFKDVTDLSGFIYKSPVVNCEMSGDFDKREIALYKVPEWVGIKATSDDDEDINELNKLSIKTSNLTDEYYDIFYEELGNISSDKRELYMKILKEM